MTPPSRSSASRLGPVLRRLRSEGRVKIILFDHPHIGAVADIAGVSRLWEVTPEEFARIAEEWFRSEHRARKARGSDGNEEEGSA